MTDSTFPLIVEKGNLSIVIFFWILTLQGGPKVELIDPS
jgi:hypothetical protein